MLLYNTNHHLSKRRLYSSFIRSSMKKCRSTTTTAIFGSNTHRWSSSSSSLLQSSINPVSSTIHLTNHDGSSTFRSTGICPQMQQDRCFSSSTLAHNNNTGQCFYEMGWLDEEHGLTQFDTLHELTFRSNKIFADNECLGIYMSHRKQFSYGTYRMAEEAINKCRHVLKNLGVEPYDKIGIISRNRWEWACIAAAAYSLNATIVPMYEQQHTSDWSYIINDSQCAVLLCSTQDIFHRVQKEVVPQTNAGTLKLGVLCFDAPIHEEYSFERLMLQAQQGDEDGSLIIPPMPEDLSNIIYTSGTTGKPKGVELTHFNITSNVKSSTRSMVENPKEHLFESDRSLSILPWAHIYGQTCELWMGWAHGCSTALTRGYEYVQEDLQLVQPTLLCAVPTVYKKVFDGLQKHMEDPNLCSPKEKVIIQRALRFGRKRVLASRGEGPPLTFIERIRFRILDKLVLAKIRERLGGRVRYGFNGGAACPKEVIDLMDSIGIPVFEGFGLSETSPIITVNSPEQRKVGTVGRPIGGVQVYIIDPEDEAETPTPLPPGTEGEICCVGPNVMKGYHNNMEETNQVLTRAPDGESLMFHTGDLGTLDDEGYIKVTGRLKEQYKLDNGKYVVPTPVEDTIGMSRFISQVVLVGANRPYNIALIVPDYETIKIELEMDNIDIIDKSKIEYSHYQHHGNNNNGRDGAKEKVTFNNGLFMINEEDIEAIHNDQRVKDLIDAEVQQSCYTLKKYEIPKKWAFVSPLTVENKMLTAKMSIRRKPVMEKYSEVISTLYGDNEQEEKMRVVA